MSRSGEVIALRPEDPRIAALRRIVADHQAEKVQGVLVDVVTASAILTVHDAINAENRRKLLSFHVGVMAHVCWGTLDKAQKPAEGA